MEEQVSRQEILELAEAVRELSEQIRELHRDLRPPGSAPTAEQVDAALARASRAAALRQEEARSRADSGSMSAMEADPTSNEG